MKNQRHQFVHYFIQLGLEFDEVFFDSKTNPFARRDYQTRAKRYDPLITILYTEEAIVNIDQNRFVVDVFFSFRIVKIGSFEILLKVKTNKIVK